MSHSPEHLQRLEKIVEHTTNMVIVTDAERRIEWVNPAYTKVTGWTLAEVKGKHPRSFLHGTETSLAEASRISGMLNKGLPVQDVEMLNYRKSGEPYWVALNIQPIFDERGHVAEYVAIQSDITERKHAQKLVHERALLDRAAKTQMETLAHVSHELRTPLHALLGFTDLVERAEGNKLQPSSKRGLEQIRASAQHLLLLVNDMQDLARLHDGRIPLDLQAVSLPEVVAETLAMLEPVAARRGITLIMEDCMAPLLAQADRRRLTQVLINLIGNAIKYNRADGTVSIRLAALSEDVVAIAVTDTGVGIATQHLERLFEPFYTIADAGSDRDDRGSTGLGLAISKSLLEAMGGDIRVESKPAIGSTFFMSLPRATGNVLQASPTPAEPQAREVVHSAQGTVLYIEDAEVNRILIDAYLEARPGVTLVCSEDGASGVATARQLQPGLILVDIHLPDMSGYEVLHAILDDAKLRHIPCIAFSANTDIEDVERAIRCGFREFLPKPSSADAFLAMIDRLLGADPAAN